ncbi:filamentous hemagglutinin N-terminal domain-containing protein, partial [uncultured Cloacibacillus sp.]|uniref:two-partner secretion domain-containing protein n=1 Tax=uncultured Cloacibacillus sp. TaxID=889794 RepID=UPI002639B26F
MIHQRKILKAIAYAILLCFTSLTGAQPLYAVPGNNHTPSINTPGAGVTVTPNGEILNIHQTGQTAVNKWNDFSIGADATVNFTGTVDGFNSFNYVKDGPVSEIYGQLNAIGGNIFIANPAGVQIGNSAQINVGSLYVTNRELEQSHLDAIAGKNTAAAIGDYLRTNGTIANPAAELMSLGSITSATSVTFDGSRIVLDTDRLFTSESGGGIGETQMDINAINKNVVIKTDDADKVVLGYSAYDDKGNPAAEGAFKPIDTKFTNIFENGTKVSGGIGRYMWVEDVFQLQAMQKYTNGWFALRNAIDANYSKNMNNGAGFSSIGSDTAFTGRFDGLDYHIFGLTIGSEDDRQNNIGLFGQVGDGAIIRNVTLNGGSITGDENVGSIAGSVTGSALIENITNTADIDGTNNVGGIIGSLDGAKGGKPNVHNFVNSGSVNGKTNVGGIVGYADSITLDGRIYNLGAVLGTENNVGGIVGYANDTTIGNPLGADAYTIYNQLGVTGGWNVGGIVGLIEGNSTVQNVANHGDVKATGNTIETYLYNTVNGQKPSEIQDVHVANVGGIAGKADGLGGELTITDVKNDGDVKTSSQKSQEYTDGNGNKFTLDRYDAGNVGGVVGFANNVRIENAENSENHVAGAHNVGGVAGYLTGKSVVNSSQNDGGDITATGARKGNEFVKETPAGSDPDTVLKVKHKCKASHCLS